MNEVHRKSPKEMSFETGMTRDGTESSIPTKGRSTP